MDAARKPSKRKATAKTAARNKGAKTRPVRILKTRSPLQESNASQTLRDDELDRDHQLELEAAHDRDADLYDFSPVGHLTLDRDGTIVEANLMAGTLLGTNRKALIGQSLARFIAAEDEGIFHRHCQEVLNTSTRQACEVQLRKKAGASHYLYLKSLAVHKGSGRFTHWRTSFLDISDRKRAEQESEAQRAQLEAIIGAAMDAIISVDETQRVIVFNAAAESVFLCPAADAIGQPLERFIPQRFHEAHRNHIQTFAKTKVSTRSAGRLESLVGLRTNGEEFPFEGSVSQVTVGNSRLFTVILRDITERKAAEEALRSSGAFTRTVLNSLSAHVCVLDKDGVILTTNDAWKEFAHINSDRALTGIDVGQNYLEVCRRAIAEGESMAQTTLEGIEAVLAGRAPIFTQEYDCHSPIEERWFLMRVTPLKGAQGAVISHTDISERVRMARALEQHILLLGEKREEMESLAGKLIEAQEQERKRIARELHDDFNQRLAALALELEALERLSIGHSPDLIPRQLAGIRADLGRLSDDLHDLAYKLHPSLIEHVGLEVAMRDHVAEFTKRTGVPVTFTAREVPAALSPAVTTNLYRVMQESLQNVFKHAQASAVTVRLSGSSKGIGVSVRDNGKGFDLENKGARMKGIGLTSMQERARLLGGFLRIHSLPKEGTKVCAWIPSAREDA
ncbi:PAS domain S-box protein [Nitrospira sp. NS4]|uniref:sensor histidine kinase n=1 Tax=Nitrospira sp. NS4 TaxID=3414498 RepID=UPI003C2FEE24